MRTFKKLAPSFHTVGVLASFGLARGVFAYSPDLPSRYGIAVPTTEVSNIGDFYNILCVVTQWIMVFGLILGALFVVWGGVKYITSAGESGKAEDAKEIIITALIGIVFLILAVALVRLVATFFGSASFSSFSLLTCR